MARVEAENALTRLTSHQQYGGFNLPAEHRSVVEATALLEKMTAAFNRITELQRERSATWTTSGAAASACESWLRDARPPGAELEDWDGPEPQLQKGEKTLLDAIENRRRRVREIMADLHRIRSAPFPSSWAKQRMREAVDQLAARGAPDPTNILENGGEIIWPSMRLTSDVHAAERALAFTEVPDMLALVAWLMKDALIKRLDGEIASEADDAAALTHEARREREAEVLADLLACERDEAGLTWAAMEQSLPVEFRGDMNPLAILQVQMVSVAAHGSPGTSPGHAFDVVFGGR
jgi:hypothetical protein